MLRAKATLVIVHPPTFGEQYFRDILGDAGLAVLEHLTPHEIGGLVAPDWVAEAVEYTRQHMENLYSMLPEWTKQFKDVGGAVEGTENYHRIAAAIYYSPVIAGWAQHMKSSVNLAPQCLTLRRTNRFKYETPMPDALHSALSTALTLAQTKDPTP